MASKYRASEEVAAQIAQLTAEADALRAKADSDEGLTDEEKARLAEIVAQLEALSAEREEAAVAERLAAVKARTAQPTRPAPRFAPEQYRGNRTGTQGEALLTYLRSFTADPDTSAEANYKCRSHGFTLGQPTAKLDVDFSKLSFKNRTVLTKGGSGSGAELIYKTYSDKVVEYLTYESPFLGALSSENTSDGNIRTYFKLDDTALESAYITASSGTESNPTISEANIATASVDIACFDITSGFQKVSFQELRDAAVNLEDKIAKANGLSHARKLEKEVINATGNGTTGVQGLMQVDNALTPVASFDVDALEELYYSVPVQYRQNAMFLYTDAVAKQLRQNLKDTTGRSLFDKNVVDGVEWDTLLGKRAYVSRHMPADTILFFAPEFYMLRMVNGQIFQVLRERFAPHVAWLGLMSFGGAWLGPTGASGAIHSLTLSA